jgi:hypothetical protein
MSLWKKSQKCSPIQFFVEIIAKFLQWKKVAQKFYDFQKSAQSKQSPNR